MNFLLCPFSDTKLTQTLDFYLGTQPGGFQVQNFAKIEIDGEPPAPPTKVVPLSASRFSISNESASGEMAHLTIDGEEYLYMTRLFKKISD